MFESVLYLGTLSGKTFLRWPECDSVVISVISCNKISGILIVLERKKPDEKTELASDSKHTVYQSALKSTHHWCIFIHYWSIFQLGFRCRDNKRDWRTLMVLTAFLQQNKVAQHKSRWYTLWYINGFICIKQWCLSIKWIFEGIALLLQMNWCWGPCWRPYSGVRWGMRRGAGSNLPNTESPASLGIWTSHQLPSLTSSLPQTINVNSNPAVVFTSVIDLCAIGEKPEHIFFLPTGTVNT